jgi:hypothetical protein
MKNKIGLLIGIAVLSAAITSAVAKSVTTLSGHTVTVGTLSDLETTRATDASVYALRPGYQGTLVATYDFALQGGVVSAISLPGAAVPKGAILLENAVIEVNTAVLPATSTNAIAVGGVTVLATGTTLGSTGIKAAVATQAVTTAAGAVILTVTGSAATSGVFTVYIPYILGTATE